MKTIAFIDYANVKAWAANRKLFVNLKRLSQILQEQKTSLILFYYGTDNNVASLNFLNKLKSFNLTVVTKPVQYFHVDLISLFQKPINQKILLHINPQIRSQFLKEIKRLSKQKLVCLLPKANFDVEITMDMLKQKNNFDKFVLFSGDGDFANLIADLKKAGKTIIVIAGRKFLSGKLIKEASSFVTLERFMQRNKNVFYKANPSTKRGT